MQKLSLYIFLLLLPLLGFSQEKNTVIKNIQKEAYENSQLEILGHELLDDIGP